MCPGAAQPIQFLRRCDRILAPYDETGHRVLNQAVESPPFELPCSIIIPAKRVHKNKPVAGGAQFVFAASHYLLKGTEERLISHQQGHGVVPNRTVRNASHNGPVARAAL
jgi:hypothetical protein